MQEISQHLGYAIRSRCRAVRPDSIVERLAYEFKQIYARLRRSCAACWDREEQVYDVLTFLAFLLCLRFKRRAGPWR